jgi:very-short-patch-repair endonuclease/Holliday junction resolvase
MTPDDVARLFPCHAGLFDVVIVDEASHVDLPSVTPVAYRGKKVVIFGDSKQMQPRRFAFMSQDVTRQAWQQTGMERLDSDRWLHPSEQSLLTLAQVRAEEETLLDEHFRSLPPIIRFSNERWYDGKLRVMTDERHKRFGRPDQPIMQLHRVPDGIISNDSQENEAEARTWSTFWRSWSRIPITTGPASGVMCLFQQQVALVQDLVAERIPPEEWEDHQLVVINPDGFQGDERDVILYSLSYDAKVMPQAAISARMQDQAHVQGMLNVAFTRARDEVHIFHTAAIDAFCFADGRPGALGDWLGHCAAIEAAPRSATAGSRLGQVDSEFEGDVAAALRSKGLRVLHQYPACGFQIDLVVERAEDEARVAVECDGERYHIDEHGMLKVEDLERQAILERAGWRVVRIPYRKWIQDAGAEVQRVLAAVDLEANEMLNGNGTGNGHGEEDGVDEPAARPPISPSMPAAPSRSAGSQQRVTREEAALVKALQRTPVERGEGVPSRPGSSRLQAPDPEVAIHAAEGGLRPGPPQAHRGRGWRALPVTRRSNRSVAGQRYQRRPSTISLRATQVLGVPAQVAIVSNRSEDSVSTCEVACHASMQKSTRHNKIVGDFGEHLLCNWLSRTGFEVTRVDHTGIDVLASRDGKRIGISVKSRTRDEGKETDSVTVFETKRAGREKLVAACESFGCEPWIAVYVERSTSADVYLTSLANSSSTTGLPECVPPTSGR